MGVEEAGTHGALGNPQDLADLGVRHPLDVEHRDHHSVFYRQLHHRLVQSLLEFGKIGFPHRVAAGGQFQKLFVILDIGVQVVQAHLTPFHPFLEEVDGHVFADGVKPCVKT